MSRQKYHQPIQKENSSLRSRIPARLAKMVEKNEFCLAYIKFYIPVGNLVEAEWLP